MGAGAFDCDDDEVGGIVCGGACNVSRLAGWPLFAFGKPVARRPKIFFVFSTDVLKSMTTKARPKPLVTESENYFFRKLNSSLK